MNLSKFLATVLLAFICVSAGQAAAGGGVLPTLTRGQTVYVSVYSNVFSGPKALRVNLSAILTIRNTDMKNPLVVSAIDYYDTEGRLLRRHLAAPVRLNPLATKYIHIKESESVGGPGSNFIVRWYAGKPINPPIVETVMVGTRGGQGISFIAPGQVIAE